MPQLSEIKQQNSTPNKNENYWVMVLLYFASFLIGLGIISVVAANWKYIPEEVKIGGAFALMTINAGAIALCVRFEKHTLKQVLCCIYAFLIMAVMGLIGQIYHLRSDINNACLLWSLCCWPLILITPRLLWLWLPISFLGCSTEYSLSRELISTVDYSFNTSDGTATILRQLGRILVVYGVIFAYEFWMIYAKPQNKSVENPLRFFSAIWLMSPLSAVILRLNTDATDNHWYSIWDIQKYDFTWVIFPILGYIIAGILIYGLNKKANRRTFMPYFLLAAAIELLLVWLGVFEYKELAFPITYFLVMYGYAQYHKRQGLQVLSQLCIIVWFIITYEENIFDIIPFLIICAILALYSYFNKMKKLFNTAIILAVIRILSYYANADNLTDLGLYLIGSGLAIIITLLGLLKLNRVLWEKKNDNLQ